MKYRCSHCSRVFDLQDRDFRRCPNCFWTTSIAPVEGESDLFIRGGRPAAPCAELAQPEAEKTLPRNPFRPKLVILLFALSALGVFSFVFFKIGTHVPKFHVNLSELIPRKQIKESGPPRTAPKSNGMRPAESFLTEEEKKEIAQPLQVTLPRQLTQDEDEILKKQVSFPARLTEKPALRMWNKEDFEKAIDSEQDKRKIRLGGSYVRSLVKTFESSYPAAFEAFERGDYALARELFLKSLAFRAYRNDPGRHRAVALVMLRTFMNDVIGKVATLNQYLLTQNMTTEARAIFEPYQALFPVLELQEWDRALQMIQELKEKIAAFEKRPQNSQADYPAVFGTLDPEIQAAIQSEAEPRPEAAVQLKPLTVDLNLKENIVRQNTPDALLKAQKRCEEISRLIREKNWSEARQALRDMEYPPEIAHEARKKIALIDKMLALQEAGGK